MNRFVIADSTVCIGCRTCEAACSETHRQHGLQAMPRLQVMRNEKESAPQMCHHCEDAPCAAVCPVNAINRVDGAVQRRGTHHPRPGRGQPLGGDGDPAGGGSGESLGHRRRLAVATDKTA